MLIYMSLLFILIGSTSAIKQGDFGILSACLTKNESLRFKLDCSYANCSNSPSYHCEFMTANGTLLAQSSACRLILPDHRLQYRNKTTVYNCTLTRKKRREVKQITIDYSIQKGKRHIKPCPATTGLKLHGAPTVLWPVVILSLWRVLSTDSQTT